MIFFTLINASLDHVSIDIIGNKESHEVNQSISNPNIITKESIIRIFLKAKHPTNYKPNFLSEFLWKNTYLRIEDNQSETLKILLNNINNEYFEANAVEIYIKSIKYSLIYKGNSANIKLLEKYLGKENINKSKDMLKKIVQKDFSELYLLESWGIQKDQASEILKYIDGVEYINILIDSFATIAILGFLLGEMGIF